MDVAADLSDGRSGQIAYLSASPFEMYHILNRLDAAPRHPVFGHLLLPEEPADRPLPCVIACHGSRGWAQHHHDHITNWLKGGIAVFRVHSFDARHIESTVETQMMVTHAMMLNDAFAALKENGVEVVGAWVDPPGHDFFFVVETDDYGALVEGLRPIVPAGSATIRPVGDVQTQVQAAMSQN